MSYIMHKWADSDNLAERLEMLVFCLQKVLADKNIDWDLPEDFNYLKFDSNDNEHEKLVKKYYEGLYEKFGRLIDEMSGECYVTNNRELPKLETKI